MRKKLFLLAVFCFSCTYIFAQEQIIHIERKGGKLAITQLDTNIKPVRLTKEQLRNLFAETQYSAYKTAHNCYIASIPLYAVSGLSVGSSLSFFIMGIYNDIEGYYNPISNISVRRNMQDSPLLYIISGLAMGLALPTLIPGIVLFVYGTKHLNKIANNYNLQQKLSYQKEVKLNINYVGNGIGLKITF